MQIFVFDPLLGGGLGEITPSGTVSRRLCSPDSPLAPSTDPFSITGGTSSDIWFLIASDIRSYQSVERGDCIGWGAYAAGFQSPTPQAGITTTRDGTVWFAENNSIYRLVSSRPWDSVTPVPLP
jgi:hypothetical protein